MVNQEIVDELNKKGYYIVENYFQKKNVIN